MKNKGRKVVYGSENDHKIVAWVMKSRDAGNFVSYTNLRKNGKQIVENNRNDLITVFGASQGWAHRFCKRHAISLRTKTCVPKLIPMYVTIYI